MKRSVGERALASPNDVVLGAPRHPPRRTVLTASAVAAILHLGAGAVTVALASTKEAPAQRPRAQPLVVVEHVVDLTPPAAPEPPPAAPEPEPPPPPPPPPKVKQKAAPKAPEAPVAKVETPPAPPEAPEPPADKPPSEPPPAAQAGQVVAAAPSAEPAPDSFKVATGTGSGYAGGTTSATGTGSQANHTGQIGQGNGNGLSRARPPQLRSRNWPCGWPADAEDSDLEEAFATVRISVQADGSISNVEVLSDPGYGFGKLAAACARTKVKFEPALDADGKAVAGVTPAVRIRFVRDE